MPKFMVDGIEYHTEDLSDEGQAQVKNLQFLEAQMRKLKSELAVYETAKATYVKGLKAELDKSLAAKRSAGGKGS